MGTPNDAEAHKDTVDPEAWAIVDGKLYFTHNQYWLQVWQEKAEEHIRQGDRDWAAVENLAAPEVVGPPCTASPATTKVALRDGGHWVVVAGQVARDDSGNVVGKGDMRGRSSRSAKRRRLPQRRWGDSQGRIFTVSYVTQPAEFEKYADLRERYFGPPSAKSSIVPVAQLTGPDVLIQVEAFAKTP
jgi:enamine deaminase RidA (YjgF/YER057c/UK114 family)